MRRILFLLLLASNVAAADVAVPADVQMGIFGNIWRLDRAFKPAAEIPLGILCQHEHRASVVAKDEIVSAIRSLRMPVRWVIVELSNTSELSRQLAGIDVLYITPLRAIDVREIAKLCRTQHIRSITGVPDYVDAGIAVGIGVRRDRPLIIINLPASRAEGSAFSAQLLKLARIVE